MKKVKIEFLYIIAFISLLIAGIFKTQILLNLLLFWLIVIIIVNLLRRSILIPFAGSPEEKKAYYTKIISRNPTNGEAYYNRGVTYFWEGKYDEALDDFSKAIEFFKKPFLAHSYDFRGRIYLIKDRYNEAVSDLTKGIEINPNMPELYVNRAEAYFKLKQYDKSWEDVHKVESLKPEEDYPGELVEVNSNFLIQLKEASGREK